MSRYIAILIILLLILSTQKTYSYNIKSKIREKRQKLLKIKRQIYEKRKKLWYINLQENDVERQLKKTQQKLRDIEYRMRQLTLAISNAKYNLNVIENRLAKLYNQLREYKSAFSYRLLSIYKYNNISFLFSLLSTKNVNELLDRTYYFSLIVKQDLGILKYIQYQKKKIEKEKSKLAIQIEKLKKLKKQIKSEKKLHSSLLKKRKELLSKIEARRKSYMKDIVFLEHSSRAIERSIENLIRQAQRRYSGKRKIRYTGKFIWPSYTHLITSPFGWRWHPVLGRRAFHTGVDIGAAYGTPIKATASGRVIMARYYDGYGYAVMIYHGNNITSLYGHCSRLLVYKGQYVNQGQTIALVGSTGRSTGPHIHFEIRVNGKPVNPLLWVR